MAEAGKMDHLSSLVEYLKDLCRSFGQEEGQDLTLAGQDVVINLEYKKPVKAMQMELWNGIFSRGFWA